MRSIDEQKRLDSDIDKYQVIGAEDRDNLLIYLCYKKMLLATPRDFVYFKGIRKEAHEGVWSDVARSINFVSNSPHKEKNVLGRIILSGLTARDLSQGEQQPHRKCFVRLYTEVDLQIEMPVFVMRKFVRSQSRQYIEKLIARIAELYPLA
eukprot:TRINITY_DN17463_c0_g1_i2.p1 TRINITY_DN17463_c0_g1~~TRINITY_DN17463_c0_g1_i2.p1  ORF type:complete len:151 (-),score=34.08 TRINITY_DN17463_c0_g1_i2:31-483(-)